MSYSVTGGDILSIRADAAVLSLEQTMGVCDEAVSARLAKAGGEALRAEMRGVRFLPVGSACAIKAAQLPFQSLILTVPPRYLTGKANELPILRRQYENVYAAAERCGCRRLAMPFLSTWNYRFPKAEAVHVALRSAEKSPIETVFLADTALCALAGTPYRRPKITDYVGWYRNHAVFALDNGLYAQVDLRPELQAVAVIPYIEACFRTGNNPLQPTLPEEEIARLRRIYEQTEI